jgi:thiazole synthase
MWDESLTIAGRSLRSRLILGTEGYGSGTAMRRCHGAAAAEMVTVTVRTLDLGRPGESVLDSIDQGRVTVLASTAGCLSADEAVRTAYLAREAGLGDFVEIDVTGDERTGMPDQAATMEAVRTLARDGFVALPVSLGDPVAARRLVDAGAAALVVLGAPPGSGLGVGDPWAVRLVLEAVSVPVLVGRGIGTASHAAMAMELGCHGVVVGSAVPGARDPEAMAEAMRLGVEAGRCAYRAGRIGRRLHRGTYGPPD